MMQQLTTEGGVNYEKGCVNLHYTIFPSLLYTGGALPGMLAQKSYWIIAPHHSCTFLN